MSAPREVKKRDVAYRRMTDFARRTGVTPLSREQFLAEDQRILTEWNRRRLGVDTAEAEHRSTLAESPLPPVCSGVVYEKSYRRHSLWVRIQHAWLVLIGKVGVYR